MVLPTKKGMSLCHMSKGELDGLDILQGGKDIDKRTGFRQYPALGKIIELPGIKDIFRHVMNEVGEKGHISSDLEKIYKTSKEVMNIPFEEAPGEKLNPEKQLSKHGRQGDNQMAFLPHNVVEFFLELKGEPSINPKDGLLEFFFKKVFKAITSPVTSVLNAVSGGRGNEIIRIASTIGGAMLGGPMGAGLGNALGSVATGKSFSDSAMSGLKNYGLATGIQGLGQLAGFGAATPGTAGFFGNAAAPTAATVAAGETAKTSANPGALASILDSKWLPAAGLGAVGLLQHQAAKDHYAFDKEQNEKRNKEIEEEREHSGYNLKFNSQGSRRPKGRWIKNPRFNGGLNGEPAYIEPDLPHYKAGGLLSSPVKSTGIKGPGDGQSDSIKTDMPHGTFIISADVTSFLGNGSSDSGIKVLDKVTREIRKKHDPSIVKKVEKMVAKKNALVPVAVATDEYKIDPVTVTLAGEGDLEKGSRVFHQLMENARKHRNTSGTKLPPAAKSPFDYMRTG